ncbi:MAG: SIMPL domain-containing protein [Bacteroidetes bacterium]|nr:SIMPL domain-containing protein [Bacteroidota bacterium]
MKATLFSILATAILFISCQNQNPVKKMRVKTMHLNAAGEVTVEPDEASISITLSCVDNDINRSKSCLLEKSDELNALLAEHKIDKKDIVTTRLNQNKDYEWKNGSYQFVGYNSSVSTHVTFHDFEKLETIYSLLLSNENISVGDLRFGHSKMDSLENVAYQNAVDEANLLADKLLAKMPETEKEILRIGNVQLSTSSTENDGLYNLKAFDDNYAQNARKDKSIKINTGDLMLSKTIFVEYSIK